MTSRKVYIVVLNYIEWEDTVECIESLLRSSHGDFSIIVVDNNSGNDSIRHIIERVRAAHPSIDLREFASASADQIEITMPPRLIFVQNHLNAGFAAGNNIVLRLLCELDAYVWLLNPDMVVCENTLEKLVNCAEAQAQECVVGAEIRTLPAGQDHAFYGGGSVNLRIGTVRPLTDLKAAGTLDYISGGCLFTAAGNFKKYGLLPEEYFLYWEETDWCFRAKQKGAVLFVCSEAICYHKVSSIIGRGFLSDYYYCRNSLLFVSKFRRRNLPLALSAMILRLLKRAVAGRAGKASGAWRGTIDFIKGKSGKAEFASRIV